jgi:23S rRNA (cytidine1920-2'-O)/16S rRNA (cytidine1409-2'-O)-methyltransferase
MSTATVPKKRPATGSPVNPKANEQAAAAIAKPASRLACAETRNPPPSPVSAALVLSAVPITSTPSTTEATSAGALNPNAKGATIKMGARIVSRMALTWIGMSLSNVISKRVLAVERVFLCEGGHTERFVHAGYLVVMAARKRLDTLLVERGLFESRSKASAAVLAGEIRLGAGRERAGKAGMMVAGDIEVEVERRSPYVSRGGLKLERALASFDVSTEGKLCLDAGASTGGFTDCLLQVGAARVVALDVAYGELDWRLRQDPRVVVIERQNARTLEPAALPYAPELITVDVSFIGLEKVLPALARCGARSFDLLALVKPQFQLGRERVGKGGVVRSADDRLEALVRVGEAARALGLAVHGYCASGVVGPAGNRESFIWCTEAARPGVEDLVRVALVAEPEARELSGVRG